MPPRFRYFALIIIELAILSVLVIATRCVNYRDVFVDGNIYFTDADCYARMCAEHPGLIVRHHDFENFPQGTTPHTTAPLDYLILSLSILLKPFTAEPIDLAGAVELLFSGGLHDRVALPACAGHIARGGVDGICVVDVTAPSVLGRADLA
jgi:hypothetical protein